MFGYEKRGFTLAEVLITMGIIGVIAAMTIPTLITNYQRSIWGTRLKKAYSITSNACERMLTEENIDSVIESDVYSGTEESWKKYLKLAKNPIPLKDIYSTMQLPDGIEINPGIDSSYKGFLFYVDVNGKDLPNEVGKDVFTFALDNDCNMDRATSTIPTDCFFKVVDNNWKIPHNEKYCSGNNTYTTACQNNSAQCLTVKSTADEAKEAEEEAKKQE